MNNNITQDLVNVSIALSNAVVTGRFMSAEHAKAVWLKFLRGTGIDVSREFPKPIGKSVEIEAKK